MLVTSCLDNVCRLWVETILPDDGLVDLEQFDPNSSVDPKFHTHRHKKRFLQRLKTIRYGKRSKSQKIEPYFYLLVAEVRWVSLKDFYFPLTFQTISPEILLSHRRAYHNFIYFLAKKSPKILKACYQLLVPQLTSNNTLLLAKKFPFKHQFHQLVFFSLFLVDGSLSL